jgi:pimeloyl-ACP methyl ester carboxylesterase
MASTIPIAHRLVAFVTRGHHVNDLTIMSGDWPLAATACGQNPSLVFLHPGVGDRRCWLELMALLPVDHAVLAYDRRGFGDTPAGDAPFAHTDDLQAVLDVCATGPAVLVGNSQGGRVAIDFALLRPDRVERLVLIAPAISGAPEPDWDAELGRELVAAIEAAEEREDLDEVNRWDALVWLDGVAGPEGRIGGPERELFLAMNLVTLRSESTPGRIEPPSAYEHLERLEMPVLVIVGALDLPYQRAGARALAERLPDARLVELGGMAHLPQLEAPDTLASLIREFLAPE